MYNEWRHQIQYRSCYLYVYLCLLVVSVDVFNILCSCQFIVHIRCINVYYCVLRFLGNPTSSLQKICIRSNMWWQVVIVHCLNANLASSREDRGECFIGLLRWSVSGFSSTFAATFFIRTDDNHSLFLWLHSFIVVRDIFPIFDQGFLHQLWNWNLLSCTNKQNQCAFIWDFKTVLLPCSCFSLLLLVHLPTAVDQNSWNQWKNEFFWQIIS